MQGTLGELEPVAVRRGGKTKDGGFNYSLIFGQRRVAAIAYAYAKAKIDKEEGIKDSPFKKAEPVVIAFEVKVNEDDVATISEVGAATPAPAAVKPHQPPQLLKAITAPK